MGDNHAKVISINGDYTYSINARDGAWDTMLGTGYVNCSCGLATNQWLPINGLCSYEYKSIWICGRES